MKMCYLSKKYSLAGIIGKWQKETMITPVTPELVSAIIDMLLIFVRWENNPTFFIMSRVKAEEKFGREHTDYEIKIKVKKGHRAIELYDSQDSSWPYELNAPLLVVWRKNITRGPWEIIVSDYREEEWT